MPRRPSFQFYPEDFVIGTNAMSRAAVGAYISMLCHAWATGPVPDTPHALWKALGLGPDDPPLEAIWAVVRPKWVLGPAGWTNARLERSRAERDLYVERQRTKGQRGGRPKKSRGFLKTSGKQKPGESPPSPSPTPSPSKKDPPVSSPVDLDLSGLRSRATGEDAGAFTHEKKP